MNSSNQVTMGKKYEQSKINYEEREREIISRTENEIDEEHKKR